MEETANRLQWLLELENRKQKPRLAHEAGAGAPCMNCNSACPGLDLHFWRKICKNCKCSRNEHDVDDNEFPQFDLLFGSNGKLKKKSMRLQVNNKKHNEDETMFEWVPPDVTKELVMDYMKALPVERLPIKGSTGAALRRQLLQKQLPLHDIDHKVCDELSEQEQKQFEKYLENIKKYVGQGNVIKILGARPFDRSLMTPVNATDMQCYSSQHKLYVPSTGVQLRIPSSFAVKNVHARHPYKTQKEQNVAINDNKISSTEEYKHSLDNVSINSNIAKSQLIEEKQIYENLQCVNNTVPIDEKGLNSKIINFSIPIHLAEQEIIPARKMRAAGNYVPYKENSVEEHREIHSTMPYLTYVETVNNEASTAESVLANALLPPSAIHANDIIGSTLDEERLMFIREKLANKYNAAESAVGHAVLKLSRPLGTDILHPCDDKTKETNNFTNVNTNTKIAAVTTATKNLVGTFAENAEVHTSLKAERKIYKSPFQVIESTIAPASINMHEQQCSLLLNHKAANNNPLVIEASTASMETTTDPLSNKHNSTNSTVPILTLSPQTSSQYPVNTSLSQAKLNSSVLQSAVAHSEQLRNQVFPHIIENINEHPAQDTQHMDYLKDSVEDLKITSTKLYKCEKCCEDIRIGNVAVTVEKTNNAFWHPGCFVCSVCDELLVDLVYFYYKNKLYCERDLAAFLGIPRCFACDELIFVREYTVAEGHNYHVKHFCCWDCDIPLAGQQYITENDRPLCLPCYQKSYAKTCAACNIAIAADQQGVAIKNLNFHATEICFSCYGCKKNLLNGRMAIKEDRLFCSKECIAKFLNR